VKDLMAAATAMRIHVEGEKRLQQQNSILQFQLADQQRLAADLGRPGFLYSIVHLYRFHQYGSGSSFSSYPLRIRMRIQIKGANLDPDSGQTWMSQ
jgi:hypothetical protein